MWLQCLDNTCIFSIEPRYSLKRHMIFHIRRKPISVIIALAKKYNVCKSPETENFKILAELLAEKSVVQIEK